MIPNLLYETADHLRKWWHDARYIDFKNPPQVVSPIVVSATGIDDTKNIQGAIDHVSGTDTPGYAQFLMAMAQYDAKWYRFFIRKPFWVRGGLVNLTSGIYSVGSLDFTRPDMTLRGAGAKAITIKRSHKR